LRRIAIIAYACERNDDRKPPVSLPSLSCLEDAALEAPVGNGSSFWIWGRVAVALRSVRNAVLRARDAGAPSFLCALRDLRQWGITAHLRGARSRDDCNSLASTADSGVAMRAVPAQVFFGETVIERTKSASHARELSRLQEIRMFENREVFVEQMPV
jgi:hypothetical protein